MATPARRRRRVTWLPYTAAARCRDGDGATCAYRIASRSLQRFASGDAGGYGGVRKIKDVS
jgi:hypothetical protein